MRKFLIDGMVQACVNLTLLTVIVVGGYKLLTNNAEHRALTSVSVAVCIWIYLYYNYWATRENNEDIYRKFRDDEKENRT